MIVKSLAYTRLLSRFAPRMGLVTLRQTFVRRSMMALPLRGRSRMRLIHALDEGLLRHILQEKLDCDIGIWSTLEV